MSGPAFSVVVPTVDRPALLLRCLDAVLGGSFSDLEVVVVDQSRTDATRAALREHLGGEPRVRYLHSDVTGASRARNLGAAQATGRILAFVDDDAVPVPGWLAAYDSAFRGPEPIPGMVGGRITPIWERPCPDWYPEKCLPLLGLHDAGDEVRPFPAGDFPVSANFAIPRDLFGRLGGFDTSLGFDVGRRNPLLGGEDSLLGLQVANAGRTVLYHPGAAVGHLVRKEKLTRAYFLRRCYWHGRTYHQLRRRSGGDRRGAAEVLRDARAREPRLTDSSRRDGLPARLGLVAAGIAFVAGYVAETARSALSR